MECEATDLECVNEDGNTALHLACMYAHTACAELLLPQPHHTLLMPNSHHLPTEGVEESDDGVGLGGQAGMCMVGDDDGGAEDLNMDATGASAHNTASLPLNISSSLDHNFNFRVLTHLLNVFDLHYLNCSRREC